MSKSPVTIIRANSMYWVKLPDQKPGHVSQVNLANCIAIIPLETLEPSIFLETITGDRLLVTGDNVDFILNEIETYRNKLLRGEV